jgi:hypothetical protein
LPWVGTKVLCLESIATWRSFMDPSSQLRVFGASCWKGMSPTQVKWGEWMCRLIDQRRWLGFRVQARVAAVQWMENLEIRTLDGLGCVVWCGIWCMVSCGPSVEWIRNGRMDTDTPAIPACRLSTALPVLYDPDTPAIFCSLPALTALLDINRSRQTNNSDSTQASQALRGCGGVLKDNVLGTHLHIIPSAGLLTLSGTPATKNG